MESVGRPQSLIQSPGNSLTYKRDQYGVIQWDCLAPNPVKQTTADYDEPDGDVGTLLTRGDSPNTGQNGGKTDSFKSTSSLVSTTGNSCHIEEFNTSTGKRETNQAVYPGHATGDVFPPCIATGSSSSLPDDPQVKKISPNVLRKTEATGSFCPQYSPLTPPATPKKSPRILAQSEGQVQGHSQLYAQVFREGSKFSFPDNVSSEQRWASPVESPVISSPNNNTAPTAIPTQGRKENVRFISPVPASGYPPKSPVVLSFQFDRDVDELVLKKIIKKINDDVAKESEEIKPITLQDPPKHKQKKKHVRWDENTIKSDDKGEATPIGLDYMEEREQLYTDDEERYPPIKSCPSAMVGLQLPNKELLQRPRAVYPDSPVLPTAPARDEHGTRNQQIEIENAHKGVYSGQFQPSHKSEVQRHFSFAFPAKQNAQSFPCQHDANESDINDEHLLESPQSFGWDGKPFCMPGNVIGFSSLTDTSKVLKISRGSNRVMENSLSIDENPEISDSYILRPRSSQFVRDPLPTVSTAQIVDKRTTLADHFLIPSSQLKFGPPRSSTFTKTSSEGSVNFPFSNSPHSPLDSRFLVPPSAASPSHQSPFLFPPSSPSGKYSPFGQFPFTVPQSSPSRSKKQSADFLPSSPLRHPSMNVDDVKQNVGYQPPLKSPNMGSRNYYGRRENPESSFPRNTLPPTQNPWRFPASPENQHSPRTSGEINLHDQRRRSCDPRRQLFTQSTNSSSRTESDVDAALTNTILNYLVKKNILTQEDSERLLRNATGGTPDVPSKHRLSPYAHPDGSTPTGHGPLPPGNLDEVQNRLLRQRGHSMGEIEQRLFARNLEHSQAPSIHRSHSVPVPASPSASSCTETRGREADRKRRRGNIDIRVECEEVVERKRQLTDDLAELNQPTGSQSCCCAEVEDQILQMTREAYTKIRRHDDTPEAFERFENEVQQTNNNITEALCILRTLKKLCGHGRSIEQIYSGSIVFRVNCPSSSALTELWSWYRSGELLDLFQRGLLTDSVMLTFNAEEIKLRVTIEETDFLSCREELECLDKCDIFDKTEETRHGAQHSPDMNNENFPKAGYLTPKKIRHCLEDNLHSSFPREAFDFSSAFLSSAMTTTTTPPQQYNPAAWGRSSPRPSSNFSEYRVAVSQSPLSPKTPPGFSVFRGAMPDYNPQRESTLSPILNRKAFQELNCNPQ